MNLGVEVREEAGSRPASPAKALYTVHSVRPSTKYVEVEGPNKSFLRNALAPPRPVLPRKHESFHKPPNGIRERVPLTSSLKGKPC